MLLVRSLLFVLLHIVTMIFFTVVGVLVLPFPFSIRYRAISQWARLNLWLLKHICGVEYKVTGKENIPEQACVILCKHQSSWETLVLQEIFPPQVWVLKRELLWIPFFGWALAALKPIAIDRSAGRKALNQIIKQGIARLEQGYWVVVFPEGTRMPSGEMGRFGIGGARLAVESGRLIVPVAHNAGKAWPKHGLIKQPGVIELVIGQPINVIDKSASLVNNEAREWISTQMIRLELDAEITEAQG